MERERALRELRASIARQIELTREASAAGVMQLRPILEQKDRELSRALLRIYELLGGQ